MGNAKAIQRPILKLRPSEEHLNPGAFLIDKVEQCPADFPGFVYVIQWGDEGPVKIGLATNPDFRLKELQVGNWIELSIRALIPTPCKPKIVERAAHRLALPHWIRGEWFDLQPLEAVNCVLRAADDLGIKVKPFAQAVAEFLAAEKMDTKLRCRAYDLVERRKLRVRLGMDPLPSKSEP